MEAGGDPAPASAPEEAVASLPADPAPAEPPAVAKPSAIDIFLASGDEPAEDSDAVVVDASDPAPAVAPAGDPVAAEPPAADVAAAADPEAASPPGPAELPVVDDVAADSSSSGTTLKPFLGVGIRNVENTKVTTLYEGSAAASLGITLGDELVSVNGESVTNMDTLRAVLASLGVGDPVTVEVKRSGGIIALGPVSLSGR